MGAKSGRLGHEDDLGSLLPVLLCFPQSRRANGPSGFPVWSKDSPLPRGHCLRSPHASNTDSSIHQKSKTTRLGMVYVTEFWSGENFGPADQAVRKFLWKNGPGQKKVRVCPLECATCYATLEQLQTLKQLWACFTRVWDLVNQVLQYLISSNAWFASMYSQWWDSVNTQVPI